MTPSGSAGSEYKNGTTTDARKQGFHAETHINHRLRRDRQSGLCVISRI
jgi:hypothetical protein